jgi:hypothetical protein
MVNTFALDISHDEAKTWLCDLGPIVTTITIYEPPEIGDLQWNFSIACCLNYHIANFFSINFQWDAL